MDSPVVGPHEDPLRTYTTEEEQQLTEQLLGLLMRIHDAKYSERAFDQRLLEEFHRDIFDSVRNHAGRCRAPGQGSEYVTFGPHRSYKNDDVPDSLTEIFAKLGKGIASLDNNPDAPEFEATALHIAAWTHTEIIRVHPFEDGNGRTSRAFLSAILVRVGMRPIAYEVPKQEYLALLNLYYETGDLGPFIDLCIQLYPDIV